MDVTDVLLDILIVLVAAKVAAEIAERINVPAVVAEIVAGAIIGPSVLSLVGGDETLKVLGELGVILLLLGVGMEMDLEELGAVGRASMSVAMVGVAVPMVGGYFVATALGHDSNQSLFIGAALAATSVGITARVFSDLRALATVEARTVLGAAVADDVLGLVILTVVVRLVSEGSVSIVDVAVIVAIAVGFLVVTAVLGSKFAPGFFQFVDRHAQSAGTVVALALAFTLAFAELADMAKLAPIVGAFVAGLALSRSSAKDRIERELAPVGHLFIPVFFLGIGIDAQVEKFVNPEVLGIAAGLLVGRDHREARRRSRRLRVARRQVAHRDRHDPPRGGRADLRHHRAQRGHPRRQSLRRLAARGPRHHDHDAAAPEMAAEPGARRAQGAARQQPGATGGWLARGRRRRRRPRHRASLAPRPRPLVRSRARDRARRACPDRACSTGSASGARPPLRWDGDATRQLFAVLLDGDARVVAVPRDDRSPRTGAP